MAKKTVKTKAKAKPKTKAKAKPQAKPQAVKTVVKKEPVARVINKPQPGKTNNKEKVSKFLLLASVALAIVAFCVTFAPAFNVQYFDENKILLGTGTVTSLFTAMLCFTRSSYVFNVDATGAVFEDTRQAVYNRESAFAIAMAAVIVLLVLVTIVVLVLILTKKYKGKIKLAFSITSWALLLATVVLVFISSVVIYRVRVPYDWQNGKIGIVVDSIKTSLGLAPILCGSFGALALGTNVTSFVLNRK